MTRRTALVAAAAWPVAGAAAEPLQRLQVGPARPVATLALAARLARDGALVEVDAGVYVDDVAVWTQNDLTLRAVGGRVRLLSQGASAEGKGIWVVRGERVQVQGFDFEGARVPSRNGAGIRFERGTLHVRDCRFLHNEMGLLTGNDPASTLDVEDSEFAFNQRPDGHNHNLYVGAIGRVSVTGSYLHHARTGHLLKSRAAVSVIAYNRLTDEDGTASYELEFPNGGEAWVVGNLVQQGEQTENEHLVAYGAEGYRWPANALRMAHNTLVDGRGSGGVFLRIAPGHGLVRLQNNLLVGDGALGAPAGADLRRNARAAIADLASAATGDYRLRPGAAAVNQARLEPQDDTAGRLVPSREYRHPCGTAALAGPPRHPGALQGLAAR
ncbi:right-handed parallel beta-helix repeat-containing protein [Aquincola agrisoli]